MKLLVQQNDFYDHFKDVVAEMEAEFGHERVVAQLHCDAATYFERDQQVKNFCAKKGIRQTFSPPGTPALNSLSERTIRTVCEMSRAMMIHARAPASMWGEAVVYSVFILNNLAYKNGSKATRNSLFYGKSPPTQPPHRIVPFMCAAWAHVASGEEGKALHHTKGIPCLVMGWDERRGAWRLCHRSDYSRLKFSGHVVFNMDEFPCREQHSEHLDHFFVTDNRQCQAPVTPDPDELPVTLAATRERRAVTPSAQALRNLVGGDSVHAVISHGNYTTHVDDWAHAVNSYDSADLPGGDIFFTVLQDYALSTITRSDPADWLAAMQEPQIKRQKWIDGGKHEHKRLKDNESFGPWQPISELPKGTKLVRMGDVLKTKRDATTKVRVVIKGFTMQPGIHFNETFSPTVFITTFRVLLALGAMHDWDIWQGDAPSAFMQPKIDTEIYVTPTPMMRHFDGQLQELEKKHGAGKVAAKVLKGMPGIPQGSRLWNLHMHKILTSQSCKLTRSQIDYGLYILPGFTLYILVWVDDIFNDVRG